MLKTGKKLLGSVCFHGWIVKERNGKLHFLQVDRWKGFGAENEIPLSGPTETARKGKERKYEKMKKHFASSPSTITSARTLRLRCHTAVSAAPPSRTLRRQCHRPLLSFQDWG